jgi:glucose-6-phosphate isomerase
MVERAHLKHTERVVVPYAQALFRCRLSAQLVLESQGKRVGRDGGAADRRSFPALWGEVGSNSQHSFFQWLHQGPRERRSSSSCRSQPHIPSGDQQTLLVANALARRARDDGPSRGRHPAELAVQGCQVRTWMPPSRRANVPATAHRRCC